MATIACRHYYPSGQNRSHWKPHCNALYPQLNSTGIANAVPCHNVEIEVLKNVTCGSKPLKGHEFPSHPIALSEVQVGIKVGIKSGYKSALKTCSRVSCRISAYSSSPNSSRSFSRSDSCSSSLCKSLQEGHFCQQC